MREKPNYYAIITAEVRYDKDLSSSEKLLYGEISALANSTGVCWASNKYFADLYGVEIRTVKRWVSNLSDKGYVSVSYTYKDDSKEIEKREIRLNPLSNLGDVRTKMSRGVVTKMSRGSDKNVPYNNTSINNTRKKNNKENVELNLDDLRQVVEYLNKKADKQFKPTTQATKKHIKARFNEGFTVDEMKRVIDKKVMEWKGDKEMDKYLRPQTLFASKFESYLNETKPPKKSKTSNEEYMGSLETFFDDIK